MCIIIQTDQNVHSRLPWWFLWSGSTTLNQSRCFPANGWLPWSAWWPSQQEWQVRKRTFPSPRASMDWQELLLWLPEHRGSSNIWAAPSSLHAQFWFLELIMEFCHFYFHPNRALPLICIEQTLGKFSIRKSENHPKGGFFMGVLWRFIYL